MREFWIREFLHIRALLNAYQFPIRDPPDSSIREWTSCQTTDTGEVRAELNILHCED